MTGTRLRAVQDLDRWLRGAAPSPSAASPTFYQAQRLDLLLAILDLREGARVTSHEVACRLVYPRMTIGRGAAWKASPERRRTQRLIREAESLAAGGYRALLAGMPGRQK
ncbi:DNA -binding domain-containing protein [Sphingopyxis sp.]